MAWMVEWWFSFLIWQDVIEKIFEIFLGTFVYLFDWSFTEVCFKSPIYKTCINLSMCFPQNRLQDSIRANDD